MLALRLRRDLSMLKDMWDPMRTNVGFAPHMFFPLDLCDSYLFPLSNKGYPVNAAVFPDRAENRKRECVKLKRASVSLNSRGRPNRPGATPSPIVLGRFRARGQA